MFNPGYDEEYERTPVKRSNKDIVVDSAKAAGTAALVEFAIVFTTSLFRK